MPYPLNFSPAPARSLLAAFDPNQARDEKGQWTSDGGGGNGASAATKGQAANGRAVGRSSKNPATLSNYTSEADFRKQFGKTFPGLKAASTAEMLAKCHELTGLPAGVKSEITAFKGRIVIQSSGGPIVTATRFIDVDRGQVVAKNDQIILKPSAQGKGLGTQIFASQVKALQAAGVSRIEAVLSGDEYQQSNGKNAKMNGYYTWPRLGYDAKIPGSLQRKLSKILGPKAKVATVQDLMKTQKGREAWKSLGTTVKGSFDLRKNSTSSRVLGKYLRQKGIQASAAIPATGDYDLGRQGPDDLDDAILDSIWDTLETESVDAGHRLIAAFDPNQERDEFGRWTSGGGAGDPVRDALDRSGPRGWTKATDKARARVRQVLEKIDTKTPLTQADHKTLKSNLGRMTVKDLQELRSTRAPLTLGGRKAKLASELYESFKADAEGKSFERLVLGKNDRDAAKGEMKTAAKTNVAEKSPAEIAKVANLQTEIANADWSKSPASKDSFVESVRHAIDAFGKGADKLVERYGPVLGRAIVSAAIAARAVGTMATLAAEAITVGRAAPLVTVSVELGGRVLDFPTPSTLVGDGFAAIAAAPLIGMARGFESLRRSQPVAVRASMLSAGEIADIAMDWLESFDSEMDDFLGRSGAYRETDESIRQRAELAAEIVESEPIAPRKNRRLLAAFDPNQERDDSGRWTSGGGAGGSKPITREQLSQPMRDALSRLDESAAANGTKALQSILDHPDYKGPKGEEGLREVRQKLQTAFDKAELTINVVTSSGIAGSGEIKNVFQTLAKDKQYRDRRLDAEQAVLGLPRDTPIEDRPRYGAVNWSGAKEGAAPNYGDVTMVVNKDAIKERLTLVSGDSFDHDDSRGVGTGKNPMAALAQSNRAREIAGLPPGDASRIGDGYTEFQIAGKLPIDAAHVSEIRIQMKVVLFPGTAAIEKFAAEKGIPVRYYYNTGREVSLEDVAAMRPKAPTERSGAIDRLLRWMKLK